MGSEDIREVFVGNYRVIYRVDIDVVIIAVIHAARNLRVVLCPAENKPE